MKIGDEIYVHGYVDEIRNGTIIIRNEGGYFGTAPDEIMPFAQPNIEERKTGAWIGHTLLQGTSIDKDVCSECGHRFYQLAETGAVWNYCPNCGSYNGGEADDS